MVYYSLGQIVRVLGIAPKTVLAWIDSGICTPLKVGNKKSSRYGFRDIDVLAFALTLELKRRGFSTARCAAVCSWLLQKPLDALQASWQGGRSLLVIVNDLPCPRLMTRDELFENEHLPLKEALQAGVQVTAIDLRAAHEQLMEKLNAEVPLGSN